ncbi:hypothetical protein [Streptomyces sp. NPDC093589]|uniref:hypothetical protein n=1 Tax=Streptomyces sp. NPDC093589 TaxID=3366043 RepID=UPI003815DC94
MSHRSDPRRDIEGDVYVSPRHLASTTGTGDPALAPLLDLGWDLQYDEDAIMWNQVCQGALTAVTRSRA